LPDVKLAALLLCAGLHATLLDRRQIRWLALG
jgi:hypothetical protein